VPIFEISLPKVLLKDIKLLLMIAVSLVISKAFSLCEAYEGGYARWNKGYTLRVKTDLSAMFDVELLMVSVK